MEQQIFRLIFLLSDTETQFIHRFIPDLFFFLLSFTAIVAVAVPDLGDLISLIGAVASSALALIFPALLEIIVFWPVRRERRFCWVLPWVAWLVKDVLIVSLGVVGMLLGSYASISNIILNINKKDEPCQSIYRPHVIN